MIDDKKVRAVRLEMERLEKRLQEWERSCVTPADGEKTYYIVGNAASGAVRRQSMELTRELARFRKP